MIEEITQPLDGMINAEWQIVVDLTSGQSPSACITGETERFAVGFKLDDDDFHAWVGTKSDDRLEAVRQAVREHEAVDGHEDAREIGRYERLIVGYQRPANSEAKSERGRGGRGQLRR